MEKKRACIVRVSWDQLVAMDGITAWAMREASDQTQRWVGELFSFTQPLSPLWRGRDIHHRWQSVYLGKKNSIRDIVLYAKLLLTATAPDCYRWKRKICVLVRVTSGLAFHFVAPFFSFLFGVWRFEARPSSSAPQFSVLGNKIKMAFKSFRKSCFYRYPRTIYAIL